MNLKYLTSIPTSRSQAIENDIKNLESKSKVQESTSIWIRKSSTLTSKNILIPKT